MNLLLPAWPDIWEFGQRGEKKNTDTWNRTATRSTGVLWLLIYTVSRRPTPRKEASSTNIVVVLHSIYSRNLGHSKRCCCFRFFPVFSSFYFLLVEFLEIYFLKVIFLPTMVLTPTECFSRLFRRISAYPQQKGNKQNIRQKTEDKKRGGNTHVKDVFQCILTTLCIN